MLVHRSMTAVCSVRVVGTYTVAMVLLSLVSAIQPTSVPKNVTWKGLENNSE